MQVFQRFYILLIICIAVVAGTTPVAAQRTLAERRYEDSVAAVQRAERASYVRKLNTINGDSARQQTIPIFSTNGGSVANTPWFINKPAQQKNSGKEAFFYLLAGLVLVLGLVRSNSPRYFAGLFSLFFRVSFRQQAIRDQLSQNSFPSLLLNVIFFFSGGLFLTLLSRYYGWMGKGFWYSLGFWSVILVAVYLFKLMVMQFLSWLFQLREAGKTYTFIVFLMNKIIGIVLLPFIVLLGLGPEKWQPAIVTFALVLLTGLFIYRYLISYPAVKNTVRVNRFHFIIYLWALEIVPLLLIYKGLALQLSLKN